MWCCVCVVWVGWGDLSRDTMQIKQFCKLMRRTRETHTRQQRWQCNSKKWRTDIKSANVTVWDRKWETEAIKTSCHLQRGHGAAESTTIHLTQSLPSSLALHSSSSSYILQLIEEQFYIIVTIYVLSIFIRSCGIWSVNGSHVRT